VKLTLLEYTSDAKDVFLVAKLKLGLVPLYILHHLIISNRSKSHPVDMTDLLNTRLSSTDTIYALGIKTCKSACTI
jgi:hypothetical protein